jgi:competence protein ComEC
VGDPLRAWRAARAAAAGALDAARAHPRHVVLFALVAGLLAAPLDHGVPLAAAAVAALAAGRVPLAVAAVAAVLAGAALADLRLAALGPGALPALEGRAITARAIVLEPPRRRIGGATVARVRLRSPPAVAGDIAAARFEPPSSTGSAPAVGVEVALRGTVEALPPFEVHQRRRGAHALIVAADWRPTGARRGGPAGGLDRARERAAAGLGAGLPPPAAALLRGMVLGQDEAIADDVRDDFERSGLAHLLAVSGQNVLLLCLLVLALAATAGVPLRTRLLLAAALVALYVPLAGAGPSIQRAGVMGVAGLAAALAGRPASRWYALGLAAAVTLALNPHAAAEPGWQLSFAAVAGLMALVPRMREPLARRMPGPMADAVAMTVAATLATAPLLALHFEQVSLVSLPANLVAAPVVAPVMWLGMLGIAVAQVDPRLALALNVLCAPLLGYLEWVADVAAAAPLAALPLRVVGVPGLLAGYGVLAAAGWAGLRAARRLRAHPPPAPVVVVAALVAAALALLLWPRTAPLRLAPGELAVTFLDVGQGDATLLQRDGRSVLVDTGPPGGPILRRLDEAGVGRLDLLIITHAQADHEGMALEVVAAHRPRLVLDGGAGWPTAVQRGLAAAVARAGGRRIAARAGQALRLGGMRLDVLWPPAPPPGWRPEGDPNGRAVVAHVRSGGFDLLLPADAESDVTAALRLPRVEALKVAHHGSDDAGLPAMLERIAPRVAAIEVGGENTYGHPTPGTLRALGVVPEVVRTDQDGSVRLRVLGGRMTLERGI